MNLVKKDTYKGFDIMRMLDYYSKTHSYQIYQNGSIASCLTLGSVKACRNVIDTYINNYQVNQIHEQYR